MERIDERVRQEMFVSRLIRDDWNGWGWPAKKGSVRRIL